MTTKRDLNHFTTANGQSLTWPAANASGSLTNNGSGTLTWEAASGGSSPILAYKAKTTITSGDPGAGYILWSNATQINATTLYFDHLTDDAVDIDILLISMVTGDKIYISDQNDSDNLQVWSVTATPTFFDHNNGSYISIPVSLVSSTGLGTSNFSNNHALSIIWRSGVVASGWTDSGTVVNLSTSTDQVGIGTASPNASAKVQIDSTTQGFTPPRMTTTQRNAISSPMIGLVVYNTDTSALEMYGVEGWSSTKGGESYKVEQFTTTATDGNDRGTIGGNLYVDLAVTPLDAARVIIDVVGGTVQTNVLASGTDFTVLNAGSGLKRVSWSGYNMGTAIPNGTIFRAIYPVAAANTEYKVEYFTTTATDGNDRGTIGGNLYVDLTGLPLEPNRVVVDVVGGTAQANVLLSGNDFTILDAGAGFKRVSWSGYNMGLVIPNGSTFRVMYTVQSAVNIPTAGWTDDGTVVRLNSSTDQVGIGTSSPNARAKVQIDSTTQGFLTPRMTSAQKNAISSPPNGLEVWDTDLNEKQVYTGSAWVALSTVVSGGSGGGGSANTVEVNTFFYNEVFG